MKKQLGIVALVIAGVGLVASACLITNPKNEINLNRNYDPTTNLTLQNDSDYLGLWTFNDGYLIFENTFQVQSIVFFRQGYENYKYDEFYLTINTDNDQYQIYYGKTTMEEQDLVYTTYDNIYWTNNSAKTIVIESMGDNPTGIVDFKNFLNRNATKDNSYDDNTSTSENTNPNPTIPSSQPTSQPTQPTSETPSYSLYNTTWYLNNELVLPTVLQMYDINCEVKNGTDVVIRRYTELWLNGYTVQLISGNTEYLLYQNYDNTPWYNTDLGQTPQAIQFYHGTDETNQNLITWLQENATQIGGDTPPQTTTSAPLYNLSNTTWQINETPQIEIGTVYYYVSFASDGQTYNKLIIDKENTDANARILYQYDNNLPRTVAYNSGVTPDQWINQQRRIITFFSGQDITNPYLISWLQQNATIYNPTPGSSETTSETPGSSIPQIVVNQEVVDIPAIMFNIIGMPFTFISTAFNITLFPGTKYAVNLTQLFMTILAMMAIIFIAKLIINLIGKK